LLFNHSFAREVEFMRKNVPIGINGDKTHTLKSSCQEIGSTRTHKIYEC